MRSIRGPLAALWQSRPYVSCRHLSTRPPEPRAYQQVPRQEPTPAKPVHFEEPLPEAKDPARGEEAARRVVREGVLDSRYKDASRRYTALICALPIAIYLSYELWRRRFGDVQHKTIGDAYREGKGKKEDNALETAT